MWGLTNLPQKQAAGPAPGMALDTVFNNREKKAPKHCASAAGSEPPRREGGRGSTQVPSSLVQF